MDSEKNKIYIWYLDKWYYKMNTILIRVWTHFTYFSISEKYSRFTFCKQDRGKVKEMEKSIMVLQNYYCKSLLNIVFQIKKELLTTSDCR